jgi:hypothetical protein
LPKARVFLRVLKLQLPLLVRRRHRDAGMSSLEDWRDPRR